MPMQFLQLVTKHVNTKYMLKTQLHVPEKQLNSATALLKLKAIGEKNNLHGPKDLSENMDDYLWGRKAWQRNSGSGKCYCNF